MTAAPASDRPPKTLLRLVESVQSDPRLDQRARARLRDVSRDQGNLERQQFRDLLRANEGKTEEQLIEELAPVLQHPGPKRKRGRPLGSSRLRHREKLLLAYRLHNRGLTHAQIGEQMHVSPKMVENYLRDVRSILCLNPATVDIPQHIGETLSLYDDVCSAALFISSTDPNERTKVAALQVVLTCVTGKIAFMQRVGIYSRELAEHTARIVVRNNVEKAEATGEDAMREFYFKMAETFKAEAIEQESTERGSS